MPSQAPQQQLSQLNRHPIHPLTRQHHRQHHRQQHRPQHYRPQADRLPRWLHRVWAWF